LTPEGSIDEPKTGWSGELSGNVRIMAAIFPPFPLNMHTPDLPLQDALPAYAIDAATTHLRDILAIALEHGPGQRALVVYDERTPLARALTEGYRRNLPEAGFIDFDSATPEAVLAAFRA